MTKVKICGITNIDDAMLAAHLGADMVGFNFYERSPRFIEPQVARDIVSELPETVIKVGVFVNMEAPSISQIVSKVGLSAVQLHGDEDAAFVKRLRRETRAWIIKACRITENPSTWPDAAAGVDHFLLDSFTPEYGGSGKAFDWSIVGQFDGLRDKIILAGGLNIDNVADAVRTARPFAVDVASGVESGPRRKDPTKMEAFIRNAKNA